MKCLEKGCTTEATEGRGDCWLHDGSHDAMATHASGNIDQAPRRAEEIIAEEVPRERIGTNTEDK